MAAILPIGSFGRIAAWPEVVSKEIPMTRRMHRPHLLAVLFAAAASVLFAATSEAQIRPGGPSLRRPARSNLSPYLDLLNPGASTTFNYYRLTRPAVVQGEIRNELTSSIRQAEGRFRQQDRRLDDISESRLTPTGGRPAGFFTHRGRFGVLSNR